MIAGVVPAAGLSNRMGTAKARLDADGRPFLERVVVALRDGGCSPVFVVVRDPEGTVAAIAAGCGAAVLENRHPDEGPISSTRTALDALDDAAAGIAICPVDHPKVRAETVRRLIEVFEASACPVVLPVVADRGGHPVLFRRSHFGDLLDPDLPEGARTVIRRLGAQVRRVEVDDPGIRIDIDTLPDYRRHFPASYRKRFHSR